MALEFPIEVGSYLSVALAIDDPMTDAAVTAYTGAETLSCACWAGDDQAAIFAPTVAWLDGPSGTFTLSISSAQSATLLPGRYNLQLTITAGGLPRKRTFAVLVVKPSPGSASPRPAYCVYQDLKLYAGSWLDKLLRPDVDQTGFAEERAAAREIFEGWVHQHYRGDNAVFSETRFDFPLGSEWTDQRIGLRDPDLLAWLAADKLLVTREVRQVNAMLALATICERQIDPAKDTGYFAAAAHYRGRAEDLAATLTVEIDTDGDGAGDLPIYLGLVDTLKG